MPDRNCRSVIARSASFVPRATRRAGIRERVLLPREECSHQNIVLLDLDEGARVDETPTPTSESFYVLDGTVEFSTADWTAALGAGELCHLAPGVVHGLRAVGGPARILVIFAPPNEAKS